MRTTRSGRSASISASALALLSALVFGGPPASGGPLECADPCTVATYGDSLYMPPVTQIRSGTQVLWTTATGSHPTTNTTSVAQQCFSVAVGPNVVPVAVQFDVADGALAATDDGKTTPCGNALALPTGAFLLPYQCILHVEMHGALVVEP